MFILVVMGCINKSTLVDLFAGVKMKIFPNGYRIELKELLQLAWPIVSKTIGNQYVAEQTPEICFFCLKQWPH